MYPDVVPKRPKGSAADADKQFGHVWGLSSTSVLTVTSRWPNEDGYPLAAANLQAAARAANGEFAYRLIKNFPWVHNRNQKTGFRFSAVDASVVVKETKILIAVTRQSGDKENLVNHRRLSGEEKLCGRSSEGVT